MTSNDRIKRSANYKDGRFQNLSPTPVMAEGVSYRKVIWESLHRPKSVRPAAALPSVRSDISRGSVQPVITWFGHSSYLIQANNKNILVDPVFSGHASPVSWMITAFKGADIYTANDLPDIDVLIITHNHFDHLDTGTLKKIKGKVKLVYTALGVSTDLPFFDPSIIVGLDWWQSVKMEDGMELTALPARHFSGRTLRRNLSLWTSFALKSDDFNLYLGGDSGYDTFFKEIGDRYGPFDLAILECGQYNVNWPHIHMMPEETAQAAIDLRAKTVLPVHWGKFTLANHPWSEPVNRLTKRAAEIGLKITTPMIGEQIVLNQHYPDSRWWEHVNSQQ